MAALSDITIARYVAQGKIGITPFDERKVQPASYDLSIMALGKIRLRPHNYYTGRAINAVCDAFIELIAELSNPNNSTNIDRFDDLADKIKDVRDNNSPHTSFQLLSTMEVITLPDDIRAEVHGRSSLARKGVFVHVSAGFIDPGFSGNITLECINVSGTTVDLLPGDRVAQIAFSNMDEAARIPYNGRYQGQRGPTKSRFKHGME